MHTSFENCEFRDSILAKLWLCNIEKDHFYTGTVEAGGVEQTI